MVFSEVGIHVPLTIKPGFLRLGRSVTATTEATLALRKDQRERQDDLGEETGTGFRHDAQRSGQFPEGNSEAQKGENKI